MPMEGDRFCSKCGQPLPPGQSECPRCSPRRGFWLSLEQEALILLSFPVLVVFIAVTSFATKAYHAKLKTLAEDWYSRGEVSLQAGRTEAALEDFRTALVYSHDNAHYQLRLAQALVQSNRLEEARSYLLNLWERGPGDGTVNLELGRLAMRQGNLPEGLRFFHDAIYGSWEFNAEAQRRQARFELVESLLSRGARQQAQAELLALASELPPDAILHVQVGNLLLKIADYDHALNEFRQALRFSAREEEALAGAGEASFHMGDYRGAMRYLEGAARQESQDTRVAHFLEMTKLVLSEDPFDLRLSAQERGRRAVQAFEQAVARLRECAQNRNEVLDVPEPHTDLQLAYSQAQKMKRKVRESVLSRNPDRIVSVMDLVFEIEERAETDCGPPTGLDEALLLIARKRGGPEK